MQTFGFRDVHWNFIEIDSGLDNKQKYCQHSELNLRFTPGTKVFHFFLRGKPAALLSPIIPLIYIQHRNKTGRIYVCTASKTVRIAPLPLPSEDEGEAGSAEIQFGTRDKKSRRRRDVLILQRLGRRWPPLAADQTRITIR